MIYLFIFTALNHPTLAGKRHFMKIIRIVLIAVFVFAGQLTFAQNSVIKGIITDDLNNFVEGAKITLQGTSYEGTSDSKGVFEIKDVPFGNYTLSVAADNHTAFSQEIKVNAVLTDVGFLNTQVAATMAEEMMDNVDLKLHE